MTENQMELIPIEAACVGVSQTGCVASLIETYINEITELLKRCEDAAFLDLIYQLLKKHSAQV